MIDYSVHTLSNGLRVVINRHPHTAMAAVNLMYDTGARDEDPQHTGLAHLVEHLMFGPSANVPDYTAALSAAGGTNNAWTNSDYTNFYAVVPAQNLETVLWAESDRMAMPLFTQETLEVQRKVVVEEFKQQCLNRPYGDLGHHLLPTLYGSHPYSWPVIGKTPEHISSVTREVVVDWVKAHYGPENAVLSIAGNIDEESTLQMVEKWFGGIPARGIKPRVMPAPEFPLQDTTVEVTGRVPATAIVTAIPMASYGEREYYAADLLTDILAAGQSSYMFRNLTLGRSDLFAQADASISGTVHEGYIALQAILNVSGPEAEQEARALMLHQARALADAAAIDSHRLERSLNGFETRFKLANSSYRSVGQALAQAILQNEDINATVARQRSFKAEELAAYADKLFNRTPAVTLIYRPEQNSITV